VTELSMKPTLSFKILLNHHGYSKKALREIWKWYDSSEKKGAASF